jgi:hypothetical protein
MLVRPSEPADLAAAIERLLVNPEQAFALGCAARDELARHYSFERMVHAFEDLYHTQIVAATSRSHGRPAALPHAQRRPEQRRGTAA